MKVLLILLVIVICVLGFLAFLWYASKQDTHKPIDKVKEEDKNETEFVKRMQLQHKQSHEEEAKRIELLNPENRGKLFEQAIKRKQNAYKQDDEEYELRVSKQAQSKEQQEPEKLETIKQEKEVVAEITIETQKIEERKIEEEKIREETEIGDDWEEVKLDKGRINRNESNTTFFQQKKQLENKEQESKNAIQKLREEVLLEAENLKKRRLAFISAAIT